LFKNTKIEDLKPISDLVSLKGKRALITGSASGIGRAITYRFAEAGAALELVDINEEMLRSIKEELTTLNVEVNIHRIDLSKKNEIFDLWMKFSKKEPDILVNVAGIYPFKDFLEIDEAFLENVMKINFYSVYWMCQCMVREQIGKGGVIINIGSIEAILPFKEDLTHYNSSKAGLLPLQEL